MAEVRTTYKGRSERAWLRLGLRDVYGAVELFDLVVDTASPMAMILRPDVFDRFVRWPGKEELSNFGPLPSGWFQLDVPSIVLSQPVRGYKSSQVAEINRRTDAGDLLKRVRGYTSSQVAEIAAKSHPEFAGLVGLPILRLGEYGGDASEFWFRYPIPS